MKETSTNQNSAEQADKTPDSAPIPIITEKEIKLLTQNDFDNGIKICKEGEKEFIDIPNLETAWFHVKVNGKTVHMHGRYLIRVFKQELDKANSWYPPLDSKTPLSE